jgi:hypothetical protein
MLSWEMMELGQRPGWRPESLRQIAAVTVDWVPCGIRRSRTCCYVGGRRRGPGGGQSDIETVIIPTNRRWVARLLGVTPTTAREQ